jgi:hypothetical protein
MTVQELIDELSKFSPDKEVAVGVNFNEYDDENKETDENGEEVVVGVGPVFTVTGDDNWVHIFALCFNDNLTQSWDMHRNLKGGLN